MEVRGQLWESGLFRYVNRIWVFRLGGQQHTFLCPLWFSFELRSLTGTWSFLTVLGWLASELLGSSISPGQGLQVCTTILTFYVGAEDQTQGFLFARQARYGLSSPHLNAVAALKWKCMS